MKREDSSMNVEPMSTETTNMATMSVQKNKKRGSGRRFLLLIILLICTVALLGGATYAWFTANTKVAVEDMRIEVTTAKGIQISSDAKTWDTYMTLQDLYIAGGMTLDDTVRKSDSEDAGSVNQFPGYLYNVSSLGNIITEDSKYNSKLQLFEGTAATMCWVWDADDTDHTKGSYKRAGTDGVDLTECDVSVDKPRTGLVTSSPYEEQYISCAGDEKREVNGLSSGDNGQSYTYCGEQNQVIAFDMYLKLDDASRVSLAQGSYVKNVGTKDYGLKNTIRVAFITLGTQPADYYYAEDENINNEGKLKSAVDAKATGGDTWDKLSAESKDYYNAFGGYVGKYGARIMNTFGSITIWEPNNIIHTAKARGTAETDYKYPESMTKGKAVTTHAIWSEITGKRDATVTSDYDADGDPSTPDVRKTVTVNDLGVLPMYMYETLAGDITSTTTEYHPQFFAPQINVEDPAVENTKFNTNNKTTSFNYEPYKNVINYQAEAGSESAGFTIFTAPAGVTKLRVYIWVEGSDIDTENNATASLVDVGLMFTTAETGSAPAITSAEYIKYENQTAYNKALGTSTTQSAWREGTPSTVKQAYVPTP